MVETVRVRQRIKLADRHHIVEKGRVVWTGTSDALARDSDLIPADAFAAAKMDEWLFWDQYSHEPYIAVCRMQMVYLGKSASDLDPDKVKRGYAALARMEHQLAATRYLVGDSVTLADVSLLAYTRLAHEGGFHLDGYAAIRRWIGEAERALNLAPIS